MDRWNIILVKGATFSTAVTVTGVPNISTATEWRITFAMPNAAPFLVASTINGMITAGSSAAQKIVTIPASITETLDVGNALYDFDIMFPGSVVNRYVSNGLCQVNPAVDEGAP